MPQSLSNMLVHLVFSTKGRKPMILDEFRDNLHAYIGGVIRNHNGVLLRAGSVDDHIHCLIALPRTISPADLVKDIKSSSSKWIKEQFGNLPTFAWQNGYGLFSISPSHKPALEEYLNNQKEHHKTTSFEDEYRRILRENGIEWNEQYVWD
jgi:putative transposase